MMLQFIQKVDQPAGQITKSLTLPLELRQKSRQRVVLDSGQEAAIMLSRGSILYHGDLLMSEDGQLVRVLARPERLSRILCDSPLQMARACYHLGNRHVPLQIEEGRLSFLHDHVLDDMLNRMGFQVVQVCEPFEPESGAYGGGHNGGGMHHHEH